jgi:hypothetical protein
MTEDKYVCDITEELLSNGMLPCSQDTPYNRSWSCGLLLHLGIRLLKKKKKLFLVCNLTIGFQIMLSRKMQKKDANVATDHGDLK